LGFFGVAEEERMGERPRPAVRYLLSSSTTVTKYRQLATAQDREGILAFLKERFYERYFSQLEQLKEPNGFFIMSVCAPLVEAIQAFRSGWKDIAKKRDKPYKEFFKDHLEFEVPSDRSKELYDAIRSGLSHNAETYHGWRIIKSGKVVNMEKKTINARAFLIKLRASFDRYLGTLAKRHWGTSEWEKVRNRMSGILQMCEGGPIPEEEGKDETR
jgi:hypothetical protein